MKRISVNDGNHSLLCITYLCFFEHIYCLSPVFFKPFKTNIFRVSMFFVWLNFVALCFVCHCMIYKHYLYHSICTRNLNTCIMPIQKTEIIDINKDTHTIQIYLFISISWGYGVKLPSFQLLDDWHCAVSVMKLIVFIIYSDGLMEYLNLPNSVRIQTGRYK